MRELLGQGLSRHKAAEIVLSKYPVLKWTSSALYDMLQEVGLVDLDRKQVPFWARRYLMPVANGRVEYQQLYRNEERSGGVWVCNGWFSADYDVPKGEVQDENMSFLVEATNRDEAWKKGSKKRPSNCTVINVRWVKVIPRRGTLRTYMVYVRKRKNAGRSK
jgi:hypothetical protein